MGDGDHKSNDDRLLEVLVKNTEALSNLHAAITGHAQEYVEGQRSFAELSNNLSAKVDNLDRTVSEVRHTTESAEQNRQVEMQRIFDLIEEERKDRRKAVSDGRDSYHSERDFIRQMVREEIDERKGERKESKDLLRKAGAELWRVGGRYIVAGVVLLILAMLMQAADVSLAELAGFAKR